MVFKYLNIGYIIIVISSGIFRNILWRGCKQIVKISIHGVSKEPKDTNTLNNNKKKILRP